MNMFEYIVLLQDTFIRETALKMQFIWNMNSVSFLFENSLCIYVIYTWNSVARPKVLMSVGPKTSTGHDLKSVYSTCALNSTFCYVNPSALYPFKRFLHKNSVCSLFPPTLGESPLPKPSRLHYLNNNRSPVCSVKIPFYAVPYITHFSSLGSKYFHALYHLQ